MRARRQAHAAFRTNIRTMTHAAGATRVELDLLKLFQFGFPCTPMTALPVSITTRTWREIDLERVGRAGFNLEPTPEAQLRPPISRESLSRSRSVYKVEVYTQ